MIAAIPLTTLFALLFMAVPVGVVMAIVGMIGLYSIGGWDMVAGVLTTAPLRGASSYDFLTLPMFLLMAEFVLLSGVADDLFKAAAAWTARIRGGLGMATALAGAGFGAMCGTSTASAATLSSTTIPAMLRQGYRPEMASGIVAITGTLSMLIPPAVALVIYGLIAEVNIGKLLIAGVIPAILITATILITIYILAVLDPKSAPVAESVSLREKLRMLKVTGPVLVLLLCVTGTIYSGIATPTEASALGALAGFFLALSHRKINAQSFRRALVRATYGTCMILMIVIGATIFGYYFALTQITQDIVGWISGLDVSPWWIITFIMIFYLILGCFMDETATLILMTPITVPIITAVGFDPIWFGVLVIVACEVGMVAPPVGLNCFIVSKYSGIPLGTVFAGVMPHVLAHIIALAILVAFPIITLWLPGHM